jgi:tetratricopeptide (TPR) repeat protein
LIFVLLATALSAPAAYCDEKPSPDLQSEARKIEILKKVHELREKDSPAFLAALQSVADLLPNVPVGTTYGKCNLIHVRMNAKGEGLDAVKFRVPEDAARDLVWCFYTSASPTWYIVPAKGQVGHGFEDYHSLPAVKLAMSGAPPDLVRYFQYLGAQHLAPGQEYILWFDFSTGSSAEMQLAIDCLPADQAEDSLSALAWALGQEKEIEPAPAERSEDDGNTWWHRLYREVGQHNPKWDELVEEGIRESYRGETVVATLFFDKALHGGCACPVVQYMYAHDLYDAGAVGDVARRHLWKAAEACGDQAQLKSVKFDSLQCVGSSFLKEERYEEAVQAFQRAVALNNENVKSDHWAKAEKGLHEAKSFVDLNDLKPPSADREAVRAYLRRLSEIVRERGSTFDDNVLNPRLAVIDRRNLDLLFVNLSDAYIGDACRERARKIVGEADKATVLNWLEADRRLIFTVQDHGWEADAKPILLSALAEHPSWLPNGWAHSAAMLRDPAAYDDLKWYFMHGAYPGMTYYSLTQIQLKLDPDMVLQAWKGDRDKTDFHFWLVPALLDYGLIEGLDCAVAHLEHPWSVEPAPRALMLTYTDARGTDEQLHDWYLKNKDHLEFDKKEKKFHVRTGE